ncbi:hypothetical protein EYF80_032026 [Liparis tanakae]|uniref:Uncharacterized protein n=1 Tax=Liparis tanakae TaxID=230148 RepID=A0A4Z2GVY8_9TELE|nr:hypothetical protein EYF80_032026 [Liparis tanakae]
MAGAVRVEASLRGGRVGLRVGVAVEDAEAAAENWQRKTDGERQSVGRKGKSQRGGLKKTTKASVEMLLNGGLTFDMDTHALTTGRRHAAHRLGTLTCERTVSGFVEMKWRLTTGSRERVGGCVERKR